MNSPLRSLAAFALLLPLLLCPGGASATEATDSGLLWLVNFEHQISQDYVPSDLQGSAGGLRAPAYENLQQMVADMKAAGNSAYVSSAYRTYQTQKGLFQNRLAARQRQGVSYDQAYAATRRYTAVPGTSEHQLGLAADFTTGGKLSTSFANTGAGQWLYANAAQYGFILRYDGEKEALTGVAAEPWHFRYVGMPHAQILAEKQWCLEEYVAYLQKHKSLSWSDQEGTAYEILWSEALPTANARLLDCSGDNAGGYIATYTAPTFSDVNSSDWFADEVEICATQGLLQGGGDGTFHPHGLVNADEALVMAARMLWQAKGNALPLPKGPTAEEFTAALGQDYAYLAAWHGTWAWDGISYFWSQAVRANATLPLPDSLQTPATRWQFFSWLAFAAQGMNLEGINDISALPDTDNGAILGLYRAGILTGTDEYGTFSGGRTLTRAEAAALLARLARPELRQPFTPLPAPKTGYTLTRLAEGEPWNGTPGVLCDVNGEHLITLEGKQVPWPGNGPSSTLSYFGNYMLTGVYDETTQDPYDFFMCVLDGNGTVVIPPTTYSQLYPTRDGHFIGATSPHTGWFLLDRTGAVKLEFPETPESPDIPWLAFNEGLCPWLDGATGLWGYVDATGAWVMEPQWAYADAFSGGYAVVRDDQGRYGLIDRTGATVLPFQYQHIAPLTNSPDYAGEVLFACMDETHQTLWVNLQGESIAAPESGEYRLQRNGYLDNAVQYFDLTGTPVSEVFDWVGIIGPDGRGFVGKEGGIYRIEFDK